MSFLKGWLIRDRPLPGLPDQHQNQRESDANRNEPKKPQLAIIHLLNLAKHAAPFGR